MSESKTEYEFKPKPTAIISMPVEERDKLVADARMRALEDACKAVCEDCEKGNPVYIGGESRAYFDSLVWYHEGHQYHRFWICDANSIRRLMESK